MLDFRSTFIGTPTYLAPEIIQGTNYTEKVDIWCLGVIFYELLHGRPPFSTSLSGFKAMAHLSTLITSEQVTFDDDISDDAKYAIIRMLEKNPKERPNTS